ncbi:MAG: hypothetical protein ABS35_08255 [Kaistia sp. SCN 65-12]|nr:MAG: hypothetical protein ABS35_08255 [Kaistia sp. SCN 65-12]
MRVIADTLLAALSKGGRSTSSTADESGFDQILRQAGKNHRAQAGPPPDAPPDQPGWPALAATMAGNAAADERLAETAPADAPPDEDAGIAGREPKRGKNHDPFAQTQGMALWAPTARNAFGTPSPAREAASAGPVARSVDEPALARSGPADPARSAPVIALPAKEQTAIAAPAVAPGKAGEAKGTPFPALGPSPSSGTDGLSWAPLGDDPPETAKPPAAAPETRTRPVAERPHTPAAGKQPAAPVTVTDAQSFPAPAPSPNQTVAALASAIATDGGAKQVLAASAGLVQQAPSVAVQSHMLKIELHPAELGMVTAHLRLSGGQLSIDLKPENQEAHRRLSADSDALVRSLQGLGFDVDRITVLQPSVAISATPRMDATGMAANPGGRDPSSFQPGNPGGNGEPSGNHQSGRNSGNDGHHGRQGSASPRDPAGGGLFI